MFQKIWICVIYIMLKRKREVKIHNVFYLTNILGGGRSIGGQIQIHIQIQIQSQIQIHIQIQIQSQIHYVREYTECLLTHTLGGGSSIGGHSAIDSIFSTRPSAFTHICILYMCTKIFPYSHFSAFLTLLLADTYFAKNLEMWHFEFKVKLYTYALFCNNKKTKVF